jgi:polar amino acid transport system substrate-binding protein
MAILTGLLYPVFGFAQATSIDLLFHDRPPHYVVGADGEVGGLVGTPVGQAFRQSGIAYRWVAMAANAQLKMVQETTEAICAVGWFKTPAREEFAKFSKPIYRDRPQIALTRRSDVRVLRHRTIKGLLGDNELRMGAKLGYSYGIKIDAEIERLNPTKIITSQDMVGMLRMMAGGRFDYLLSSAEEAPIMISGVPEADGAIITHELVDMPQGNERYLLCSRNTPDIMIEQFDAVITTIVK